MSDTRLKYVNFTLTSGTTSDAIDIGIGNTIVGLITPASIASTAVTIQTSATIDGTYVTVHTGAADYTKTVASSRAVSLDESLLKHCRFVKVVMGSSETAKTFTLVVRRIE